MPIRLVDVQQSVLKKNVTLAVRLRERFARSGTLVVNLLSSPGAGKTTLLEETLGRLAPTLRVAALVGDQATDNDARRLARSGVPVRQITTAAECRLDAEMVGDALAGWETGPLDVLFVENVGNLICPAEYDLGEDLRVVLFSVTEGEDKPLKYPLAFNTAQVALVTKIDLAGAVGYDRDAARYSMAQVNPSLEVLDVSVRTGEGLEQWLALLTARHGAKAGRPLATP
jgi:hydrogenase nickel incorporation protein HypB